MKDNESNIISLGKNKFNSRLSFEDTIDVGDAEDIMNILNEIEENTEEIKKDLNETEDNIVKIDFNKKR